MKYLHEAGHSPHLPGPFSVRAGAGMRAVGQPEPRLGCACSSEQHSWLLPVHLR